MAGQISSTPSRSGLHHLTITSASGLAKLFAKSGIVLVDCLFAAQEGFEQNLFFEAFLSPPPADTGLANGVKQAGSIVESRDDCRHGHGHLHRVNGHALGALMHIL